MQGGAPKSEPLIRGRAMLELVAHFDEFEAGLGGRIRARLDPAELVLIEAALPTDWIPASHTRPIIDALVAELGDRAPEVWASLVHQRLFRTPLLGGFFDMLMRLSGPSPARLIKAMPRGWHNAYKGWGALRVVELGERSGTIEFSEVPDYLFEHRQHWIAITGVLVGLVKATNHSGRARVRCNPAGRLVVANVRWRE